ncbi:hypothetical protein NC653_029961 [Populus alba x Populus x berolinensis]|uniref:PORR domain-containing protein n=1 Tax=Populus alba x Populus x berolinensis TaxID=444605 RepID=A0AAD6M3Y1_9ROSI|nr:hypothetical protein NC653_029961 [Populus alba x Populus x berolinensis]
MSNSGRLRLEHVRIARYEFGLPDDFEHSVVLKYPQFLRLVDAIETRNKYIEVVDRGPRLVACAIEKVRELEYREKGMDAEDVRFKFMVNFPTGFKIGKYYRIAVWKWQRVPYWSPYEGISGYHLRSVETQKRMEKMVVASTHELLSLTVEEKTTMEGLGNHSKLHTVFLREAYRKGELVEPNDMYLARRKLDIRGTEKTMRWSILGENGKDGEREDGLNLDLSCDVGSDSTDEEGNVDDIEKAEEAQLTGWLHNIGGIRRLSVGKHQQLRIRDVRRNELNGIGVIEEDFGHSRMAVTSHQFPGPEIFQPFLLAQFIELVDSLRGDELNKHCQDVIGSFVLGGMVWWVYLT